MKTPILTTIALLALFAVPALAGGDCVVVDHGGYLAYERGCTALAGKQGGGSTYIDTDNDGVGDTYSPDGRG